MDLTGNTADPANEHLTHHGAPVRDKHTRAVVGVWEVHAPGAPFPWHVMTFFPHGLMQQTNPPAGNREESDSAGHGMWRRASRRRRHPNVVGTFVEVKADPSSGRYLGKAEISFTVTITGSTFTGEASTRLYDAHGALQTVSSAATPLYGRRIHLP